MSENSSTHRNPVTLSNILLPPGVLFIFFFNDTATTEIYTLSLHDALPISAWVHRASPLRASFQPCPESAQERRQHPPDRKSTRLNPVTRSSRMPSSA